MEPRSELERRLAQIRAAMDLDTVLAGATGATKGIARYYRLNKRVYRRIHSRAGFVHMAISRDGKYKSDDFYEQGRVVERVIRELAATAVLELAPGQAPITKFLALRNPRVMFSALDLEHGQFDPWALRRYTNIQPRFGDFHDLSYYPNASMDVVYVIEALCYAHDRPKVLSEVWRVLRPGGQFIIFDGYDVMSLSQMDECQSLASRAIWSGMMVPAEGHFYTDLRAELDRLGFDLVEEEDLSVAIMPNVKRLERFSKKFITHSRLAHLLGRIVPTEVLNNAISGYLLPVTLYEGLHCYWYTRVTKPHEQALK